MKIEAAAVVAPELLTLEELGRLEDERKVFLSTFEPGSTVLYHLGLGFLGRPSANGDDEAGMLRVDGPAGSLNGGIFLYRVLDPLVEHWAGWTPQERFEAAQKVRVSIGAKAPPLELLTSSFDDLTSWARQACGPGRKLYFRMEW